MGYTKGEWKVADNINGIYIMVDDDHNPVAETWTKANAQLIASAPKLVEVLKSVLKTIEDSGHWWIDCPDKGGFDTEILQQALAKAEGK